MCSCCNVLALRPLVRHSEERGRRLSGMQVVRHIMQSAKDTKVLRFRHCARLLPCTHICRADMGEISATTAKAVSAAFDCCALPPALCFLRTVSRLCLLSVLLRTVSALCFPNNGVQIVCALRQICSGCFTQSALERHVCFDWLSCFATGCHVALNAQFTGETLVVASRLLAWLRG